MSGDKFQVGKRYIVHRFGHYHRHDLTEVEVIEISPGRTFVKLKLPSGIYRWDDISDWEIVEQL